MTKELEASFERLERFFESRKTYEPNNTCVLECIECLNTIKQRLESIDNANPSEALKSLGRIREFLLHKTKEVSFQDLRDIEQALIKSQEQKGMEQFFRENYEELRKENVEYKRILSIIFEKNVDILDVKIYENYEHYCRAKEDSKLRKDWWLTQEEFDSLKRYADGR